MKTWKKTSAKRADLECQSNFCFLCVLFCFVVNTFTAPVSPLLTSSLHLLQPYCPIPLLHISPPTSFTPLLSSAFCLVVCEWQSGGGGVAGVSAYALLYLRRVIEHLSSPFLSACLSVTVSLFLNVPTAQLHSHYLLISLDATATGSTVTKSAECKSVTAILTLFVRLFFPPLGGGMLNAPLVIVVI